MISYGSLQRTEQSSPLKPWLLQCRFYFQTW